MCLIKMWFGLVTGFVPLQATTNYSHWKSLLQQLWTSTGTWTWIPPVPIRSTNSWSLLKCSQLDGKEHTGSWCAQMWLVDPLPLEPVCKQLILYCGGTSQKQLRVALVRTDILPQSSPWWWEAIHSFKMSVLTRATRCNIPEDGILNVTYCCSLNWFTLVSDQGGLPGLKSQLLSADWFVDCKPKYFIWY
jgi:hypothetical protein